MRIQYTNTPTSFGFNKELNKELKQKLKCNQTKDPELVRTISELNNFCNATETRLLKCDVDNDGEFTEKDRIPSLLYGSLCSAKITLAGLVDAAYPDLNYTKREYDSYIEEANNIVRSQGEVYTWQFSLAAELGFVLPPEDTLDDESKEDSLDEDSRENVKNIIGVRIIEASDLTPEQFAKIQEAEKNSNEKSKQNSSKDNKPIGEIIERFEPTLSSPTGFESIGGMDSLKEDLYDKIIYPALHPEEAKLDFEEYGKRYPRGIMLYGPPGCGKTFILEALSQEAKLPLFKLKISKAGSKYINETSNNYQRAFDHVAEYAEYIGKPCIMFIDEVDGLTKGRDDEASEETLKQMSTLLNLVETARDNNIIVVAATNKYDIVDEAIRRRFDSQVYVGMPDEATREAVLYKTLNQRLKGIPLAENSEDLKEIAKNTAGFPSSALVILTDVAANAARKDGRRPIKKEDYFEAIVQNQNLKIDERKYQSDKTRPSIGFRQPNNEYQTTISYKKK